MSNKLKKEFIPTAEPANYMTWEESVRWLCKQPDQTSLVYYCYYDDPIADAALRFYKSGEWDNVRELLPDNKGKALDVGAGRGISSYALAKDGWDVTALEPDPSSFVGAEAIRLLSKESGTDIKVIQNYAEILPFKDSTFDLVYGRQVLHHASNLDQFLSEVSRIIKPGGCMLMTREHVISKQSDLDKFLDSHPLHKYYGGENAYTLKKYTSAITKSGLKITKILGPFDSVINYYPLTKEELNNTIYEPIIRILGSKAVNILGNESYLWGKSINKAMTNLKTIFNDSPGRLYSFKAIKCE